MPLTVYSNGRPEVALCLPWIPCAAWDPGKAEKSEKRYRYTSS